MKASVLQILIYVLNFIHMSIPFDFRIESYEIFLWVLGVIASGQNRPVKYKFFSDFYLYLALIS